MNEKICTRCGATGHGPGDCKWPLTERQILDIALGVQLPGSDAAVLEFARVLLSAAPQSDAWHDAVLAECMRVESCYVADDPARTLNNLIDWHTQPQAGQARELPPLPEPVDQLAQADGFNVIGTVDVFTAEQMEEYAMAVQSAPAQAGIVSHDVLHPSIVASDDGRQQGPELYFDPTADAAWPHGCWMCGLPDGDKYMGATPNDALVAWVAQEKNNG